MQIDRRDLLKGAAAGAIATALPGRAGAQPVFAPKPGQWRSFEIVTRVEIARKSGAVQAWIPVPSVNEASWFASGETGFETNANAAEVAREPKYGAAFVHARWDGGDDIGSIAVTSRFATQDRHVDLTTAGNGARLPDAERALCTGPTALIPIDGIVRETAERITKGAADDLDKARRLYEWVVENTFRNAATRGCGVGDVAAMLKSGNLSGKCADLNALLVGLARGAGLPARDVYGLRVAPSRFGYKSLGAGSANVTKAQHCRAEMFIAGIGWVPADPADVRKVVLEEPPGNLALGDAKVVAARKALFGAWEGNWLAYNVAHDVALPGATGPVLEFFMYPQAETVASRLDCLDPDTFKYTITAKELTV
jgi:transglutaminase-like putative cysteine protease